MSRFERKSMISNVYVPTASASRYLQQLCKHWGHKFEVTFTPEHGEIRFGDGGTVVVLDATEQALDIRLATADAETAGRMEDVVARHVERFAFRETLKFDWSREDVALI
jgi:uncharacterized protein